ncbi:MAG: Unknown protein [uncultured Thiotrichaceae bacterium]|uniref:DUF4845 domain-containing protein n=1 Tax=uncultured Thiotrichaceae bacterium TaxID=298394 RepID=A0A6S6TJ02_9GAMM|nr:MAG: Unknown protein [uncultured Thiotrichaceae bacterium]
MMNRKQGGATFITWLFGVAVAIFLAILTMKLVPVYIEHESVKSMIDDIATDSNMKDANKRVIRTKIDKVLNINSMDDQLRGKDFLIERVKGTKNRRELKVEYEVRKPWMANLDFVVKFEYAKELGSID